MEDWERICFFIDTFDLPIGVRKQHGGEEQGAREPTVVICAWRLLDLARIGRLVGQYMVMALAEELVEGTVPCFSRYHKMAEAVRLMDECVDESLFHGFYKGTGRCRRIHPYLARVHTPSERLVLRALRTRVSRCELFVRMYGTTVCPPEHGRWIETLFDRPVPPPSSFGPTERDALLRDWLLSQPVLL